MKTIIFNLLVLVLISCSRNNETEITLNSSDVAAVAAMAVETNNLVLSSTELKSATTSEQIHHWDSIFHHHDSLFWHHHSLYNENNHNPHNDHHHVWIHYEPSIDHSHHYHPVYPNHPGDSVINASNGHHSDYTNYHPEIHSLHDHHVIDSLHHLHQVYHH